MAKGGGAHVVKMDPVLYVLAAVLLAALLVFVSRVRREARAGRSAREGISLVGEGKGSTGFSKGG